MMEVHKSVWTKNPDPWAGFTVDEPPDGAPREQLLEFGALSGSAALNGWNGAYVALILKRIIRAYCEKWHPEMELPDD